jgi:hypothetical protein
LDNWDGIWNSCIASNVQIIMTMRWALVALALLLGVVEANADGQYIHAQLHNAEGWLRNKQYTYAPGPPTAPFRRVNAGPGWDPAASQYTSGQLVNNYQLISPGTCTSSPTGNGPSGTGTDITDGTCHWKYTSVVDYVTLTGWILDGGGPWVSGTWYGPRDTAYVVASNSDAFQQIVAGCISTVAPSTSITPNASGELDTGDGCRWLYIGRVTYSSGAKTFGHERWWRDSFQGYIMPSTYTATASIAMAAHSVMTVTAVTSGTITVGADVNGTGVPYGVQIYAQLTSDEPGGALGLRGTYQVTPDFLNVSSTTMTGGVGILTVTTPPVTHKIDVALGGKSVMAHPAMTDPGRAQGAGQIGTAVISGTSPGGPFVLNRSQAIHGPGGPTDPTTIYYGRLGQADLLTGDIHYVQLWNDREYLAGGPTGEMGPYIWIRFQVYSPNDTALDLAGEYGHSGFHASQYAASVAGWAGFQGHIEAAPGEGFADTLAANPSLPLAGYNINYGVGLRGNTGNPGILISENGLYWKGLQIKGDGEQAIAYETNDRNAGGEIFERNLIQGGTNGRGGFHPATIVCLALCDYYNNLIIATGTSAIHEVYGAYIVNNTIVCPSNTCWSGANSGRNWIVTSGSVLHGNAVFGFQHFHTSDWYGEEYATPPNLPHYPSTVQGVNNMTDTPSSDGADFPSTYWEDTLLGNVRLYALPFYTGATYPPSFTNDGNGNPIVGPLPPICATTPGFLIFPSNVTTPSKCQVTHGVSASAAFVSWPGNYRINPAGPLVGAGSTYGIIYMCGWDGSFVMTSTPWSGCIMSYDAADLLGTPRPQNGRYDVGAVQMLGGGFGLPAGRLLFR